MSIYMSIDPGWIKMGVSIMDENQKLIDYGLLTEFHKAHPKEANKRINAQLPYLIDTFSAYMDDNDVTHVSWEIVPGRPMSSKSMIEAAVTTLKVVAFQRKLLYHEFAALNWHNQLFQNPRIEKIDVKNWVLEKYPQVSPKLSFDVFDAIAINYLSTTEQNWITP